MKIGFIGCGNMASAMIGGIIKNQVVAPVDILASAKTEVSREKKKEELGIAMTADNREVAAYAEVLILAVKPFYYEDVIKEIRDVVADDTVRRNPACFFHLGQDSPLVGFFGIPVEILFAVADLSGGNDSDSAFFCNGACQPAKADADTHSTLDQGKSRKFITDFKILHNDQILTFICVL